MSPISDNQKNLIFGNAVARKFKLPSIFLDNQLFANIFCGVYRIYRYSKYHLHSMICTKNNNEINPVNFKPYDFKPSQFLGFDYKPSVKLSIIVPAYNVEKYITQCLDSIVNALTDFNDYEIIVVEDCSTDNTLALLKEISSNYKNLKLLINEKNLGLSEVRNKALKYSLGHYITFVDSDDMLSYGILTAVAKKIDENNNIDVFEFDFQNYIQEKNVSNFLENKMPVIKEITLLNNINDIYKFAKGFAWGKIYKRDLFELVRFPEGLYWEDAIISNIILRKTKTYMHMDTIGYLYRMNPNGISNSVKVRNLGYDQFDVTKYCLNAAKQSNLIIDGDFYKRLFVEASIFLNNRTSYLDDADILYMFNKLEPIFNDVNLEPNLNARQKLILKVMREKNIAAWRAIAF
ncbi:glycosyltransferase family 2 protein [Acinetobacter schindleri]|uniref:glycosyltransferase family 2 protein n=1 Tax=Acinetobacter schindleri TaxID=108981 RepID=UPI0032B3125C